MLPGCASSARLIVMTDVEQTRPGPSHQLHVKSRVLLTGALEMVRQAIEHQLGLRATYKRGSIILAPHILYERNGEAMVDAVILERDGVRPAEDKLGTFKLNSLRDAVTIMEPIALVQDFDAADPRYAERILACVSP